MILPESTDSTCKKTKSVFSIGKNDIEYLIYFALKNLVLWARSEAFGFA